MQKKVQSTEVGKFEALDVAVAYTPEVLLDARLSYLACENRIKLVAQRD
jgi:hypothetical protein